MAYRFSPMSQFILPVQQPVAAVPGNFAQNAIMREQLAESQRQALETEQLALRQQAERERAASVEEGLRRQQEMRERQKQDTETFLKGRQLGMMGELPAAEAAIRAGGLRLDKELVPSEQERKSWAGSMAGQMLGAPMPPVSIEPPQEQWAISRDGERLGSVDFSKGVEKGVDEAYAAFDKAMASQPTPLPPGTEDVVRMYREMAPDVVRAFNRSGGSAKDAIELLMDRMGAHLNTLGNVRRGGGGGRRGGPGLSDLYKVSQTVSRLVRNDRIRTDAPKLLERRQALASAEEILKSKNPIGDRDTVMALVRTANGGRPTDKDLSYFTGAGSLWDRMDNQISQLATGELGESFRANMLSLLSQIRTRLDREDAAAVAQVAKIASTDAFLRGVYKDDPEELLKVAESAMIQAGSGSNVEDKEAEPGADVLDLTPDE